MVPFLRMLTTAGIAVVLALPVMALADEPENLEADARQVGGDPPTIPHKVSDDADGKQCLTCHEKGIKKAPATSHPERMGCTQCHVAGEPKAKAKPAVKKAKKKQ